ncbi:hypothetical protein ACFX2I_007347 [Malus domestica]
MLNNQSWTMNVKQKLYICFICLLLGTSSLSKGSFLCIYVFPHSPHPYRFWSPTPKRRSTWLGTASITSFELQAYVAAASSSRASASAPSVQNWLFNSGATSHVTNDV